MIFGIFRSQGKLTKTAAIFLALLAVQSVSSILRAEEAQTIEGNSVVDHDKLRANLETRLQEIIAKFNKNGDFTAVRIALQSIKEIGESDLPVSVFPYFSPDFFDELDTAFSRVGKMDGFDKSVAEYGYRDNFGKFLDSLHESVHVQVINTEIAADSDVNRQQTAINLLSHHYPQAIRGLISYGYDKLVDSSLRDDRASLRANMVTASANKLVRALHLLIPPEIGSQANGESIAAKSLPQNAIDLENINFRDLLADAIKNLPATPPDEISEEDLSSAFEGIDQTTIPVTGIDLQAQPLITFDTADLPKLSFKQTASGRYQAPPFARAKYWIDYFDPRMPNSPEARQEMNLRMEPIEQSVVKNWKTVESLGRFFKDESIGGYNSAKRGLFNLLPERIKDAARLLAPPENEKQRGEIRVALYEELRTLVERLPQNPDMASIGAELRSLQGILTKEKSDAAGLPYPLFSFGDLEERLNDIEKMSDPQAKARAEFEASRYFVGFLTKFKDSVREGLPKPSVKYDGSLAHFTDSYVQEHESVKARRKALGYAGAFVESLARVPAPYAEPEGTSLAKNSTNSLPVVTATNTTYEAAVLPAPVNFFPVTK